MDSDIPKIRRPAIRPLDEWVDDFVRGVGMQVIDPGKPETIVRLRQYTRSWLRRCLNMTVSDLQRGAERGIAQSLEFMFDPNHAETTKKNRKDKAERRQQKRLEEQAARVAKEKERLGRVQ